MTCQPFTIRPATSLDAEAIAAVNVASWAETYGGLLPAEVMSGVTKAARMAMWSKILEDAGNIGCLAVFVAEIQGAAVGYVSVGNQRDEELAQMGYRAEITAVYVLKKAQRSGIGRRLLQQAARHLLGFGHSAAALWVLDTNTNARGFYEALGARLVMEREETRPEPTVCEVAYAWSDLSSLLSE